MNSPSAPRGPVRSRLEPALRIAHVLIGKTGVLAVVTGLAGLWLWSLVFYPFAGLTTAGAVVLAAFALVLLLTPAAIIGLFWLGLRTLIRLPEQVIERTDESTVTAGAVARAAVDPSTYTSAGLVPFVRSISRLRHALLESKALVLQIGAVARLINPLFVFLLLAALLLAPLMMAVAVVTVLAAVL